MSQTDTKEPELTGHGSSEAKNAVISTQEASEDQSTNHTTTITAPAPRYPHHKSFSTSVLVPMTKDSAALQQVNDPNVDKVELRVFVGTWNLHAKPAPADMSAFIPNNGVGFDMYVIGTEECEHSIQKSLLFTSKAKWTRTLVNQLGPDFEIVASETLQAIHLIVFLRSALVGSMGLKGVDSAVVKTGLGDVVGNKGGVAICFDLCATSFLFINAHFAAHQEKVHQRNADYTKINSKLDLRTDPARPMATDRFERVFWLGDLNYRVNANRQMAEALIKADMMEVMLANDQLAQEMKFGHVFQGLVEGAISFPPTYKFDTGSDSYDTSPKRRIPSWTDRILYKPSSSASSSSSASEATATADSSSEIIPQSPEANDERKEPTSPKNNSHPSSSASSTIELTAYNSVRNIRTSDHRPVFAHFTVMLNKLDDKEMEARRAQANEEIQRRERIEREREEQEKAQAQAQAESGDLERPAPSPSPSPSSSSSSPSVQVEDDTEAPNRPSPLPLPSPSSSALPASPAPSPSAASSAPSPSNAAVSNEKRSSVCIIQ